MQAAMNIGEYYLDIGNQRVSISPFDITPRKSLELNEKITNIKIAHSPFGKLPPTQDETKETYEKRFKEHFAKQDEGEKEETADQFLTRMYKSEQNMENMKYIFDCLNAICDVYGKPKSSWDQFLDVPTFAVNNFIFRICAKGHVPSGLQLEELPQPEY